MIQNPEVSIGLPVYNGDKFIRRALDSLLSQTFKNFELIISDNASTDSTQHICEEYAEKDERIRYIRQTKNMGGFWNYRFVLNEAKCNYFHWAAADDLWHPDFLKKNMQILQSEENTVGSISNVLFYDSQNTNLCDLINYSSNTSLQDQHALPAYGSYGKKTAIYLKLREASAMYAVYRTEKLRKCINHSDYIVYDFAIVLSVLKYGDLHVIDEVLMYRYQGGYSVMKSNLEYMLEHHFPLSVILFPNGPFTFWCVRQFGLKIFIKNFLLIMRFFLQGESQFALDVIGLYKKKFKNMLQIK